MRRYTITVNDVTRVTDKYIVAANTALFFSKSRVVHQHMKFTMNRQIVGWVQRVNKLDVIFVVTVT